MYVYRRNIELSSCVTPAGTSNELDVQNGWEENTHTHIEMLYRYEVIILRSIRYVQHADFILLIIVGVGKERRALVISLW